MHVYALLCMVGMHKGVSLRVVLTIFEGSGGPFPIRGGCVLSTGTAVMDGRVAVSVRRVEELSRVTVPWLTVIGVRFERA